MSGDEQPERRPKKEERDRDWTERKQKEFLHHLAWSVNVSASARAVGMSEPSVYRLRQRSPEFRAAWEVALREGYARLEVVMIERAIGGTVKPVFQGGKLAGEMVEYSDRLALALLAAHRASVRGEGEGTGDPASARKRIEEKLDAMNKRLGGEGVSGAVLPPGASMAEQLAGLPAEERRAAIAAIADEDVDGLEYQWRFWARAAQLPPERAWRVWLILAGRGFGKTRAGAEWVRGRAEADGRLRIALVGATMAEARAVMIEGESGLLAIAPPRLRPLWEPSLRRMTWANGAQAFLYSAAEPDALRGPQHHIAWADEIAKWPLGQETWDNLMLGMRLGDAPRTVATTTPKPVPLVRALLGLDGVVPKGVAITRGRTVDNGAHLPESYIAAMCETYGGTRLGRQELDGELIEDVAGALWSRALIERCRVQAVPVFRRVVVAVDPPAGADGDACGIVVAGIGADDLAYVMADASVQGLKPEGWARAVAAAAALHGADRVIAEANNGGAMVESVLRAADAGLPVRLVHATRGKTARAEPVSALYEAGRVFHIGAFPMLEDELAGLQAGGGYAGPSRSPDRADALVWAMTELMLGATKRPGLRTL